MSTPDFAELQKENEELKEYFRQILEKMDVFLPKHFDADNVQHTAMYEVYHIAIHAIRR